MSESVIEGYEERRNEEEKAKVAMERNKEFEAFTESFKEKMEFMQKALQKTQGIDDYLTTMGGITKEEASQLPPKFVIPKIDRFIGVGDPKQHLRQYHDQRHTMWSRDNSSKREWNFLWIPHEVES